MDAWLATTKCGDPGDNEFKTSKNYAGPRAYMNPRGIGCHLFFFHLFFTHDISYLLRVKNTYCSSSAGFRVAGFDAIHVERGQTLASDAISFFLPFLAGLEDLAGLRRVLAPARLFGASNNRLAATCLRALASVTIVFERLANFVHGAVLFATGSEWWRRA